MKDLVSIEEVADGLHAIAESIEFLAMAVAMVGGAIVAIKVLQICGALALVVAAKWRLWRFKVEMRRETPWVFRKNGQGDLTNFED